MFEGPFVSNVPVVMIWDVFSYPFCSSRPRFSVLCFRDNKVSNGDSGFGRGCYRMPILSNLKLARMIRKLSIAKRIDMI